MLLFLLISYNTLLLAHFPYSTLKPSYVHQWTLILDTRGMGLQHIDHAIVAAFADILQNRYPERLHRMIIFPSNAFVRGAWSGLKHFFDPNTANKVILCPDAAGLQEYVDASQLSEENGGSDPWKFNPDEVQDHFERNDMSIFEIRRRASVEAAEIGKSKHESK